MRGVLCVECPFAVRVSVTGVRVAAPAPLGWIRSLR